MEYFWTMILNKCFGLYILLFDDSGDGEDGRTQEGGSTQDGIDGGRW